MQKIRGLFFRCLTLGISFIVCLFVSYFYPSSASATEDAVEKYKNYLPEQIKNIPDKVRESEVPMMYIFAAQNGIAKDSDLLFASQLNSLMYSGVSDYQLAVRAFQKDLGDKPTGELTVSQIHKLELRSSMQKLSRLGFPNRYISNKSENNAMVEGTMIIIDDTIAWPVNHITLRCYRKEGYCEMSQINVEFPNEKSWTQTYQVVENQIEYYDIKNWGADVVDAMVPESPNKCRTTSLNLNFKTKEFYYTTRNAGGSCEVLGATFEKLPKPRISQIVDGEKIFNEAFQKVEAGAYNVLSSDFKNRVEKSLKISK